MDFEGIPSSFCLYGLEGDFRGSVFALLELRKLPCLPEPAVVSYRWK